MSVLFLFAPLSAPVFMGIENNIHQAFLSIRLDNKDKISANQVIQHNLKVNCVWLLERHSSASWSILGPRRL